jgi:predicted nucleotidyltransferase component of viral defense system
MLSKADLQRLANRQRVALGILEKDYVLTEVVKALSRVPVLNKDFVFKGGTALRKVYFPNWRYSEDLDFTVKHDINKEELRQALDAWYHQVEQESRIRLITKMIHKPDGYARIRTQFVGPLAYPGMIYMDLSFDEPLCLEPEYRRVLTDPFTDEQRKVLVYPLEELLAEKIRSLLERGKSRDYYDVWRLLKEHSSQLNLELLGKVVSDKLAHKGLCLHSMSDLLPREPRGLKRYWENDLRQQVKSLPPLEEVLGELEEMFDELVAPVISLERKEPHKDKTL